MRNARRSAKPGTERAAPASTVPAGDRLAVPSPSDAEQPSFIKRAVEIGLWCYLIAVPLRLEFAVREFIGTDSPFHARYASLFFSRMFARTFPTTAYSIWSKQ